MIFSRNIRKKYFNKLLLRRPGYICLLILFLSIASIIAEKIEMSLLEKLENRIYNDQINPSEHELLFVISSVERDSNEVDVFVTIAEPDYTSPFEEISLYPVETKETIGTNEFFGGIGLVRAHRHDGTGNLHYLPNNQLVLSELAKNLETEHGGDLGLTPEEKFGLIELLKTLTDDHEQGRPQLRRP